MCVKKFVLKNENWKNYFFSSQKSKMRLKKETKRSPTFSYNLPYETDEKKSSYEVDTSTLKQN